MKLLFFLSKKFWWRRRLPRPVKIMQIMVGLGIALSVATLLVTLSVAQGFEKEFKKALLNFHAHILIQPDEGIPLTKEEVVKACPEGSVTPYMYKEALLINKGVIKGVVLKGIENFSEKDGLVLGEALGKKLGLRTTDNGQWTGGEGPRTSSPRSWFVVHGPLSVVKLLIPKGSAISASNTLRIPIAGFFKSGLYEIDEQFALLDLKTLQKLFGLNPKTAGFEIRLQDPNLAPQIAKGLKERLDPALSIQDWTEINAPLLEAFQLEKWFFKILVGFMIAVSILNLIGAILLAIFRKKKTMAILRALGLSRAHVRRLFTLEGLSLGGLGVFAGLILGWGLLWVLKTFSFVAIDPEIYFLQKLPIDFGWVEGLTVAFLSLAFVLFISWWVSWRSSSISIREGLHGPG